jgi:hypothetical protein
MNKRRGGTIGPVSGGFSGGYNSRTDNINADAFSVERKYMHISFNVSEASAGVTMKC